MASIPQPKPGELQPQELVNYRSAEEGIQSCSNCANFQTPDGCLVVQPPVAAAGLCDLWTPTRTDEQVVDELMGSMMNVEQ